MFHLVTTKAVSIVRSKRRIVSGAFVGAVLVLSVGCSLELESDSSAVADPNQVAAVQETPPPPPVTEPPIEAPAEETLVQIPEGFRQVSEAFALKSVKKGEPGWECSGFDFCVNWVLLSLYGCPNGGYIEANIIDASGTIVSFTNDLIPQMRPGENYRTILGGFGDGGKNFELTEISCN